MVAGDSNGDRHTAVAGDGIGGRPTAAAGDGIGGKRCYWWQASSCDFAVIRKTSDVKRDSGVMRGF